MMPERIQLSRKKGWRMPPNTVKVDRSTPWGNPFVVGEYGTSKECVERYRLLCGGIAGITEEVSYADQRAHLIYVRDHIHELQGKNLACWCKIGTPCHADILLEAVKQLPLTDALATLKKVK